MHLKLKVKICIDTQNIDVSLSRLVTIGERAFRWLVHAHGTQMQLNVYSIVTFYYLYYNNALCRQLFTLRLFSVKMTVWWLYWIGPHGPASVCCSWKKLFHLNNQVGLVDLLVGEGVEFKQLYSQGSHTSVLPYNALFCDDQSLSVRHAFMTDEWF